MLLVIALLAFPPLALLALAYVLWWRQGKPKLGNAEAVPHSTQQELDKSVIRSNGMPPI